MNHAHEYAMREDILAAAELMDMPQAQAAALLAVPSPMEAIYGGWTEQKSPDLDPMLDCISDRAYAALQAQRELPVYRYPGSYAHEHGELEQYRASRKANIACAAAIDAAISEHYRDNCLGREAVSQVVEQFAMTGRSTSSPTQYATRNMTDGSPVTTKRGPGPFPSMRIRTPGGMTATWSSWWTGTIPASLIYLSMWPGMSIC